MKKNSETITHGEVLETLIRTTHLLHRQFEAYLSASGIPEYITGPRLRFLVTVFEAGKIRMNEIASKLGIQARTATQFVDALEAERLLVRTPDPSDRRATIIQLSETAPSLIAEARTAMSRAAEKVLEPMSYEERVYLMQLLDRLSVQVESSRE